MCNEISFTKLQMSPDSPTRGLIPHRSPFSLCSTEFVEPPPTKIPGYATAPYLNGVNREDSSFNQMIGDQEERCSVVVVQLRSAQPCAHFIISLLKADPERVAVDIRIFPTKLHRVFVALTRTHCSLCNRGNYQRCGRGLFPLPRAAPSTSQDLQVNEERRTVSKHSHAHFIV